VYDKVLEFIDQGTRARFSSSLPAIHTLCEHKKILKESVSELGLNDDLIQKSLGDLISQSERLKLIWMNFVRTGAEREKTTICQMIKNLAKADEALFDQFRQRGVFN
jgi:DNA integrity scanning protein DisA with diadenylate cyclase activity